jgi:hypothetical protein
MVEVQVKHLKFRESFKPECRTLLDLVVVYMNYSLPMMSYSSC